MSGFLTEEEGDNKPVVPSNPNLNEEEYKGSRVDTRYTSRKQLITHIAGYRWVLKEYYSQMVGPDDELAAQEIHRPSVYQQYLLIHDLEIRVQDPLTSSMDDPSREFTYTGSANMFATQVPNIGDMFVAEIGDGRDGLFTITETTQNSLFRDTTYAISYSLVNYLTEENHTDLKNKVVKEVWFRKDFMAMGRNPFLVSEEVKFANEIEKELHTVPREYIQQFLDREFSTLLIPSQKSNIYDPFVAKYVAMTTTTDDHPLVLQMKVLNVQDSHNDQKQTLWDAIYELQPRIINIASPKMSIHYADTGYQLAAFGSFRLSGIGRMYYHADSLSDIVNEVPTEKLDPSPEQKFNRPQDIFSAVATSELYGLPIDIKTPMPLIKPVLVDDFYVFSEAFYREDDEHMSVLELLTWCAMRNQPISISLLGKLLNQYYYWPDLEKFYYMPVLIVLMRSCFKDIN